MKLIRYVLLPLFVLGVAGTSQAAKTGEAAPAFAIQSTAGNTVKNEDFKGKYVVLEWHNRDCPYVKKHYNSGNMQALQKKWTAKNVAWLAVISSAPGKPGAGDAKTITEGMQKAKASPTAVLLDTQGAMGKAYGAKTTPHMFIIDPKGTLIYDGAIDDKALGEEKDIKSAKNYVEQALTEATGGKAVSQPVTKPYGCGIKYAS